MDARKGEVYTAFYRYEGQKSPKRLSEYLAVRPLDLEKMISEQTIFIGDGVKTHGEDLRNSLKSLALFPSLPLHLPHGAAVARRGLELLKKGELLDLATFTPIYVRPSEAEIKWREKHLD